MLFKRIKKVVSNHRLMTQMSVSFSRVAEKDSELSQLLDDTVLQIVAASEQRRLEREKEN